MKRLRPGLYVSATGQFEVERQRNEFGDRWDVYERTEDGYRGEYCQSYTYLRQAKAATERMESA